jgi:hypothetical protein
MHYIHSPKWQSGNFSDTETSARTLTSEHTHTDSTRLEASGCGEDAKDRPSAKYDTDVFHLKIYCSKDTL